jgi:hypothetical protein
MTAPPLPPDPRPQSLARGAAGDALLAVERARHGLTTWAEAHSLLATAARDLIPADDTGLYLGPPAVGFALHLASGGTGRYAGALAVLDERVTATTRARLRRAHARIDAGHRPLPAEYDLFYGLTGLGTYHLVRSSHEPVLRDVLSYLVRLTAPLDGDPEQLPGWWSPASPSTRPLPAFPPGHGGHANAGMAHGIAGPLSLLAVSARQGVLVDGQVAAMEHVCGWLDAWRQEGGNGPWWPQWITRAEHRTGRSEARGPHRPSWCYGTPGLARAQQLAGLALGDTTRRERAEAALAACLDDEAQLALITDAGICHGAAGLLHTVNRVAHEAGAATALRSRIPRLRARLRGLARRLVPDGTGFLDGSTGQALAALADARDGRTLSGWDACLLSGPQPEAGP